MTFNDFSRLKFKKNIQKYSGDLYIRTGRKKIFFSKIRKSQLNANLNIRTALYTLRNSVENNILKIGSIHRTRNLRHFLNGGQYWIIFGFFGFNYNLKIFDYAVCDVALKIVLRENH